MLSKRPMYLLLVLLSMFLGGIALDIHTPSMPTLVQYFSTDAETMKFTVSIFLLGLGLGSVVLGAVSDFCGRRLIIVISLVCFSLSSWFVTETKNIDVFLLLRFLQGVAMGGVVPNAKSMIIDLYEREEVKHVSAYVISLWTAGPIFAPIIGSYFEHYLHWEVSFYFLAAYAFVVLIIAFFLKESNRHRKDFSFQSLIKNYRHVASNRQYMGGMYILGLGYSLLVAYGLVLPFIVQDSLQQSAALYGHATLLLGVSCCVGSLINRMLVHYFDSNKIIQGALYLMALFSLLALFAVSFFPLTMYVLYLPIVCLTMAFSVVYPGCLSRCLSLFPKRSGAASALLGSGLIFLAAITSILISCLHVHTPFSLSLVFLILSLLCVAVHLFFFGRKKAVAAS